MRRERRKYPRYVLKHDSFAALGSDYSRAGRIIDISLGGLAFEYIVLDNSVGDNYSVEIFLSKGKLHLHRVPCRVVCDQEIFACASEFLETENISTRVCRIEFEPMMMGQHEQLELVLDAYSTVI